MERENFIPKTPESNLPIEGEVGATDEVYRSFIRWISERIPQEKIEIRTKDLLALASARDEQTVESLRLQLNYKVEEFLEIRYSFGFVNIRLGKIFFIPDFKNRFFGYKTLPFNKKGVRLLWKLLIGDKKRRLAVDIPEEFRELFKPRRINRPLFRFLGGYQFGTRNRFADGEIAIQEKFFTGSVADVEGMQCFDSCFSDPYTDPGHPGWEVLVLEHGAIVQRPLIQQKSGDSGGLPYGFDQDEWVVYEGKVRERISYEEFLKKYKIP